MLSTRSRPKNDTWSNVHQFTARIVACPILTGPGPVTRAVSAKECRRKPANHEECRQEVDAPPAPTSQTQPKTEPDLRLALPCGLPCLSLHRQRKTKGWPDAGVRHQSANGVDEPVRNTRSGVVWPDLVLSDVDSGSRKCNGQGQLIGVVNTPTWRGSGAVWCGLVCMCLYNLFVCVSVGRSLVPSYPDHWGDIL